MNYDYTATKAYCNGIGLVWLGDEFVRDADKEAYDLGFSQKQYDAALRHHLWQVKCLLTPQNHSWSSRILIAVYFLTGWKP